MLRIASVRDVPDTVYVYVPAQHPAASVEQQADAGHAAVAAKTVRHNAAHSEVVQAVRTQTRKTRSFEFNPNTVSLEELQDLGFSPKQAASIVAYREKGGRFHRASDFAKSYVVSDSIFRRLQPFIRIPKLDINTADSAAFDALPGIGPYYAAKMVEYRTSLGGYSCPEQFMELYRFDESRFSDIADLVECPEPHYFDLWHAGIEELAGHPAVGRYDTARSIILYRENTAPAGWTIESLAGAGIISESQALKLIRCILPPDSLSVHPEPPHQSN